jgi:hypothetical protein
VTASPSSCSFLAIPSFRLQTDPYSSRRNDQCFRYRTLLSIGVNCAQQLTGSTSSPLVSPPLFCKTDTVISYSQHGDVLLCLHPHQQRRPLSPPRDAHSRRTRNCWSRFLHLRCVLYSPLNLVLSSIALTYCSSRRLLRLDGEGCVILPFLPPISTSILTVILLTAGRVNTMLIGAAGCCIGQVLLAAGVAVDNKSGGYVATFGLCAFSSSVSSRPSTLD